MTVSPDDLADKVAIVTGAAGGIGRATVELLVERGVPVVAEDRDDAVEELRSGADGGMTVAAG
jgi:NAD(P)-dependent dehydrogenase (short-subunit alcohol dehydrogenase family)